MVKIRKNSVMNAACNITKDYDGMKAMLATKAPVITIGSVTPEARQANPAPNWYDGGTYGLNSFGMPNTGIEGYRSEGLIPKLIAEAKEAGKTLMVNIAGFSYEDYDVLAQFCDQEGAELIEANFGCPNIEVGRVVSFDKELLEKSIQAIMSATKKAELIVKVSPYSNPAELQEVAELFARLHKEHPRFVGVTTMNTMPNSFMMDDSGKPVVGAGMAGMSGKAVMPFALGQVKQFRQHLPETMMVIGVGGIESSKDAELFFEAGADAVQAATLIVRDGHAAIDRLIS